MFQNIKLSQLMISSWGKGGGTMGIFYLGQFISAKNLGLFSVVIYVTKFSAVWS